MNIRVKMFGIIALAAIIGFSFVACGGEDNGGSNNEGITKFEGKWVNLDALNHFGFSEFSWTFTGNTCVFRSVNSQGTINRPGTFTFTDTTITFIAPAGTWQGYTQGYTLSGNVLNLANDGVNNYGAFTKQ